MNLLIDRMENPGIRKTSHLLSSLTNEEPEKYTSSNDLLPMTNTNHRKEKKNLSKRSRNKSEKYLSSRYDLDAKQDWQNEYKNNKLLSPKRIKSSSALKLPTIAINDVSTSTTTLASEPSKIGLASYFNSSNQLDDGLSFNPITRQEKLKYLNPPNLLDYSSAFGGTFSELLFKPSPPKSSLPYKSTPNSSTQLGFIKERRQSSFNSPSVSPFKRRSSTVNRMRTSFSQSQQQLTPLNTNTKKKTQRSNSSNTSSTATDCLSDKRKLVNEFLQPKMNQSSIAFGQHRDSTESDFASTDYTKSLPSDQSLENILLEDLSSSSYLLSESKVSNLTPFTASSVGSSSIFMDRISSASSPTSSSSSSSSTSLSSYGSQSEKNDSCEIITSSNGSLPIIKESIQMTIRKDQTENSATTGKNSENDQARLTLTSMDCNELNYYQTHILNTIIRFETILKHDLKEFIIRDEIDLLRMVNKFDSLNLNLQQMKSNIDDLYNTIKITYLNHVHEEFDTTNPDSFESQLNESVNESVKQLEILEKKMESCQKKLLEQREVMRQLDNLVLIEKSLLESKRNVKQIYKYRYIIFDLVMLIMMICVGYFVKKIVLGIWISL
ncbi:Frt1p NDAI_0A08640 [Naumovozyma dairenensis CBS 421]|uniref:Uncharacterized protein n=1 Tax=Naumovozyma dairenensis (strain ATCC 10597 / BCRC 20456 / CBS 421 / NBRC 0211 / NRRL Y-12639) TaxID=1071378 RepID=G0W5C9_NAUDC|nr:hypothetical protein NDAI_0A08640 [Naumovozyma dairenensis CBS 421]CCD23017.1 hypothetical protein NDAI_0A08640 [Naumovozyma dairenensis CBS 421]